MKLYIDAGLSLLPEVMDTVEARAMLYAIGLQESNFTARKQMGGPAKSFWQFEKIGIDGVLEHRATKAYAEAVLDVLVIPEAEIYTAFPWNDALAASFTRLLLWQLPEPLPAEGQEEEGWKQYIKQWKPGKPRPKDWEDNFNLGWETALHE